MAGGAPQWVAAMHMMSYDQGARHSTWEFAERVARQGAELLPAAKVTPAPPLVQTAHTANPQPRPCPQPHPNPNPNPKPNSNPNPNPNRNPNPNPSPSPVTLTLGGHT